MKEVLIKPERCVGCKSCELACAVAHSRSRTLAGALTEKPAPRKRIYASQWESRKFPLNCRHCEEPLCVRVCPTGSMSKDRDTGVVSHQTALCLGCGMCELACPFGVIGRQAQGNIIVKCDRCPELEVPACVTACPTRALLFAEAGEILKSKREAVGEQLFAQAGNS
jgi:carbon-monoxide dehydrogenase iron sulfur subunit